MVPSTLVVVWPQRIEQSPSRLLFLHIDYCYCSLGARQFFWCLYTVLAHTKLLSPPTHYVLLVWRVVFVDSNARLLHLSLSIEFLKWGWFFSPLGTFGNVGDIFDRPNWQWRRRWLCYWHLVGRGQECSLTSSSSQDSPHNKELSQNVGNAGFEKPCVVERVRLGSQDILEVLWALVALFSWVSWVPVLGSPRNSGWLFVHISRFINLQLSQKRKWSILIFHFDYFLWAQKVW